MNEDYRILWLRDRVLAFLNEDDPMLFHDLLERDDRKVWKFLNALMDSNLKNIDKSEEKVIYFYKTFYDKIIEESVVVAEQVFIAPMVEEETPTPIILKKKVKKKGKGDSKKGKPTSKVTSPEEGTSEKNPDSIDEKDSEPPKEEEMAESEMEEDSTPVTPRTKSGKKKTKGEKLKKLKGKKSPRTAVETPPLPSEEPDYVYVTKIVERVVKAPDLHAHIGRLQGDSTPNNTFFMYFLRQRISRIPKCDNFPDACSIMPNYFLLGSIKGSFLSNVSLLFNKVFTPVIECQFREPETLLSWYKEESSCVVDTNNDELVYSHAMPPYEYRQISSEITETQTDPNKTPTFYFRKLSTKMNDENVTDNDIKPSKVQLMNELMRSAKIIEQTLGEVDKEYSIEFPNVDIDNIPEEEYSSAMDLLKDCVMNWENQLGYTLGMFRGKKAADEAPLSQIDFWSETTKDFSLLVEQFQRSEARSILNKVSGKYGNLVSSFNYKLAEVERIATLAAENGKFLSTISRLLKLITLTPSFKDVSNNLPELVNGLHTIWLLSRYFDSDENMVAFMKRISWLLCHKVSSTLKSETLFKSKLEDIIVQTNSAKDMLIRWKRCYLDTRQKIEVTGMGKRWEFDQKTLFTDTNYIALVCEDLHDIAVVVQEFMNIFGSEFKAAIKDPTQIDSFRKRIENLTLGVELTDFDIYKPSCRDNWQAVKETFYKDVKLLEKDVKIFIDQAFMMLKSSEDALEMLLKFKSFDTRETIKDCLESKFDVVMQEFIKEIELRQEAFNRGKKKPPTLRYQPPESGAIFWERLLYMSLKKTVLKFQKVEELKNSSFRDEAFADYAALARQMKEYEKNKFETWCINVTPLCTKSLQKSILRLEEYEYNIPLNAIQKLRQRSSKISKNPSVRSKESITTNQSAQSSVVGSASLAGKGRIISSVTTFTAGNIGSSQKRSESAWSEATNNLVLSDLRMKLSINFSADIFNIAAEAELMEYLGFTIPTVIRNLALQKDRLHVDLSAVTKMLKEYNHIVETLTAEELQFTKSILKHVENHLKPGYTRLNWNSLGIQEYVTNCSAVLKQFVSIVSQTKQIETELEERIANLKSFKLFHDEDGASKSVQEIHTFFAQIDSGRNKSFNEMLEICGGVGPMLIKLESLVLHTNSGKSVDMSLFYSSWEKKIFQVLLETLLLNLRYFNNALISSKIVFEICADLSVPDVILIPSATIIHNLIVQSATDCVRGFKSFPRWRHNTCIASHQIQSDGYPASYYDDIIREESVNELLVTIQQTALKLAADCERKLVCWKKYGKLWTTEIAAKCEKMASKNNSLSDFDEKFSFYSMVIVELDEMIPYDNVQCVRINWTQMIERVKGLCGLWKKELGARLADSTKNSMVSFQEEMVNFTKQLKNPIHSLDDFKEVLQTMSNIQKLTISSEIRYEEFKEVYHVLALHKIECDLNDVALSKLVKNQWRHLYAASLHRGHQLQPTKERFAEISQEEIRVFMEELDEFCAIYDEKGPESSGGDLDEALKLTTTFADYFEKFDAKKEELQTAEALFSLPPANYSKYLRVKSHFDTIQNLMNIYETLQSYQASWSKILWVHLNPDILMSGIDSLMKIYRKLGKIVAESSIGVSLESKLKEFKTLVPLMVDLKSDSLTERHWRLLMEKTGSSFELAADKFTLQNVFDMELHRFPGIVEEIIGSAEKEMEIENSLKIISATWQKSSFDVIPHKVGGEQRGYLIDGIGEVIQIIEDNSLILQGISSSQFITPFLNIVGKLEKSLSLFGSVIDEWIQVQRKWIYLEVVFVGGDIRTQLPDVVNKFDNVDRSILRIMSDTFKRPNVKEFCEAQGRLVELNGLSMELDNCQKSLTEYLQSKRNKFPRFYFLSDDELLSLLGNSDPSSVQPHLPKIFDNINALVIGKDSKDLPVVSGMISSEGEIMLFSNEILIDGSIEDWLNSIEKGMRHTLRFIIKKSVFDYGKNIRPKVDWLLDFLGTVCYCASQVWWTAEAEHAFDMLRTGQHNAMKMYLHQLDERLNSLVVALRTDLSRMGRKKINTMLIIDVHARDVIENFVKNSITDVTEFEWESQLRYYWDKEDDDVVINQCTASFVYGYEYFGLSSRLVITPLTDRIYLTVTQALSMNLGGAPAGPAGTGKTETVKDLAKAMGILCIVTNCGERMDYKAVGKILNGLSQCGAWGCFDEFNRIDISVLSVVSTQLQSIRNALLLKMKRFNFDGQEITINRKVGVFITMNPGYAGRTELPESVKAFFRPVVCVVPDLEMICLIMLFSEGFLTAKILAKKITVLYKLSKEQLSQQNHYDFGLRALKSVLVLAGELKRKFPLADEESLLMRALKDMNLPKFTYNDLPLFYGLLSDMFPTTECFNVDHSELEGMIETALTTDSMEVTGYQVEKIIQLVETMKTRHSTMILGASGGGKTTIIQYMQKALNLLGKPMNIHMLNPKACAMDKLYGTLDPNTRDWTDGLLTTIFRECNSPTDNDETNCILFDGDIDALWIEDMNSVMDDNKLLTLPNGERIRMQNHCSLLFEVGNLIYASPATVSRAGMIYVDSRNLHHSSYWKKWVQSCTADDAEILNAFYEKYIETTVRLVVDGLSGVQEITPLKQVVPQSSLNMITQFCYLLDASLSKFYSLNIASDEDLSSANWRDVLECIFIHSLYFSFGAVLDDSSQIVFDEFVKRISGLLLVNDTIEKKAGVGFLPVAEKTVYDYFFDMEEAHWVAWKWITPNYVHNRDVDFRDIIVPTLDTLRIDWLLKTHVNLKRPILLTGGTGASKTSSALSYLRSLPSQTNYSIVMNFSSSTTSSMVHQNIQSMAEKRTKHTYGPPLGTKLTIFIDDLNMPQVDEYGTQQPIAFLKLLFERGGFYDIFGDQSWVHLIDTSFIAAMGKPGGGRALLDERFLSKFSIFHATVPSHETLHYIFSLALMGHAQILPASVQSVVPQITEVTLRLIGEIVGDLPPTPAKFHYTFSPKDVSRIVSGLCQVTPNHFSTPETFIRAWRNEFTRVICDRLISFEDLDIVKKKLEDVIIETFENESDYVLREPLLFGDFRNACCEEEPRYYEDLLDYEAIQSLFQEILEKYNDSVGHLQMILFEHAIEHLTRIHRVLRLNRGHMTIVGVSGSGKRTLAKLATFASECQFYELVDSSSQSVQQLQVDIKNVCLQCGVENKQTVLFAAATPNLRDDFFEFVNSLLTVGISSSIFDDTEKDEIMATLRESHGLKKGEVWDFFSARCNKNLHIILSFPAIGDMFRSKCRKFPGIVNDSTINWYFAWPQEALISLAKGFLAENPEVEECYRSLSVDFAVHVHTSVELQSADFTKKYRRKNYVTPKLYLSFIKLFLTMLKDKNEENSMAVQRLAKGIQKISDAGLELDKLNEELNAQNIIVTKKNAACDALLQEIQIGTANANQKKDVATKKKVEIEEQKKIILREKEEATEILDKALPALEGAKTALADLDKNDITEIRSFTTPPIAVQTVCECVLYLLGVKDISWKSVKATMADPYFLMKLRELNCDQITVTQQRLCKAHSKSLPPDLKAYSIAAHGLMSYVNAVLSYCAVYREVKPKKEKVAQLEQDNIDSQQFLEEIQRDIKTVEDQLMALNSRYSEAMKEKNILNEETALMMKRLVAADRLLLGLSSENVRWREELDKLSSDRKNIIGNALLSSGFLTYCGPFPFEIRNALINQDWKETLVVMGIPVDPDFRVETTLTNDVEIGKWNSQGLPFDELSVQNAILTVKGTRFPLCIDPQQQALSWIRRKEEKFLKITRFDQPDYLKHLEMAIKYGHTLLFENVEEFIDPAVEKMLEKNYQSKGIRKFVIIGDKEIEVDPKFQLYVTTKLPNPNLPPSIYAKATIINFTVTESGLENQLLSIVVRNERNDLEEAREALIQNIFQNKSELRNLEDSLLRELSTITGNMLDNLELIEALEASKTNATIVNEQLQTCEITSRDLERSRNEYRKVARRGSALYFVFTDMSVVNHMYQFSLDSFIDVFLVSVINAPADAFLKRRLSNIISLLTKNMYEFGCLGMFERHKILFSFLMTMKLVETGKLMKSELSFLIKGGSLETRSEPNPYLWLSPNNWQSLLSLQSEFPDAFGSILEIISKDPSSWMTWSELEAPETAPFPGNYSVILRPFQRILLLKCFRLDRVYRCIIEYVTLMMGKEFITPPAVTIAEIYKKTTPTIPVIFILSAGSQPANDVMKLAETCGMSGGKVKSASLGQGQEALALSLLDVAVTQGQWLLLQNCHLLISFLRQLEQSIRDLSKPHPDFRLWLTSEPTDNFPIGILQRSLKVVTEPPNGLKMNLLSTFLKIPPDYFTYCDHPFMTPLAFVFSFFHAVVQERRKYGKIGWNISYDFNDSDIIVSLEIVKTYLSKISKEDEKVQWSSLRYLTGEVIYGGRVIDDLDRRIVKTYMEEYFGDFLFNSQQLFHFYKEDGKEFNMPHCDSLHGYVKYINSLPSTDQPGVFGLHSNAEIRYYSDCVRDLCSNLIEMQPVSSETFAEMTVDEIVDSAAVDILTKIPPTFDLKRIRKIFEMSMTPITVLLLQELETFNFLIDELSTSLNLLRKSLIGETEMNDKLDDIHRSILNGQLPTSWRKLCPQTKRSLGSWLSHFERRINQYSSWAHNGDVIVIWLAGLHVPEAFLTALNQMTCRSNGWALDRSTLFTDVSQYYRADDVEVGLEQGCYVEGLYLEGARWDMDENCLKSPLPKILVEPLPLLKVIPVEKHKHKVQHTIRTPVYITSDRRDAMGKGLVFEADLKTKEHGNLWILQGVCLLLNND